MDGGIVYLVLLFTINFMRVSAIYFDESSRIVISSTSSKPGSDFGFSLGFQDTVPANLIVGAPRHDFIGKVYKCPIIDIEARVGCQLLDIDMERLANYTLDKNQDQHFFMGASIAATQDYFLTCAPMWTAKNDKRVSDVYGTCFVHNNTENHYTRYTGLFEKDRRATAMTTGGGIGWNTLIDHNNKVILIAKNALKGDIAYLQSEKPLEVRSTLVKLIGSRQSNNEDMSYLYSRSNIGNGLTAGNFLSNSTIYAFSMTTATMTGQIAFAKYEVRGAGKQLKLVKNANGKELFTITNDVIGAIFGAALHGEDLNGDGYSELLVGAPGYYDDEEKFDLGAVYIYIGGDMKINDKSRMRAIIASKSGGRFGSAIASKDLDGDGKPEIFISSPYEDTGAGAVYILSGHEVNKKLLGQVTNRQMSLRDLEFTQRLQKETSRNFGYSLHVLPDIDDNGCNELAVGSPGSNEVILFRGIPAVFINMTSQLVGETYVKEQAKQFVVAVCVYIEYLPKPENITGTFVVNTEIVGDGAYIPKPTFLVDLSEKKPVQCANVTVMLSDEAPGSYRFIAQAEVHVLNDNIINAKEFNKSWVTVKEYSKTKTSISVVRRCEKEDCNPKLSTSLHGPKVYLLGSSDNVTVMVTVRNDGHESNDGCVRVRVVGAQVLRFECPKQEEEYHCTIKRLGRNKAQSLPIILNTTNPLSTDEKLLVEVKLYESCNQPNYTTNKLEVQYELTSDPVFLHGLTTISEYNVTDQQIFDAKTKTINYGREYEIVNTGSVTWLDATAVIAIEKRPFISAYKGSLTDTICSTKEEGHEILFECNFTLLPNSTTKGVAMVEIEKDRIMNNLINGKLNTTSKMTLILKPLMAEKSENLTTVITYVKELSVLNNKFVIILVSILLAIIILAIFIFILYKANFFKRKQKKKLNEARESIRRKSLRRPTTEAEEQKTNSDDVTDIQVVECVASGMAASTTDDNVVLIEAEAQVH